MSTPDNRPPSATDFVRNDDLASTLNNIMAQLMSISKRLDLQGTTLAQHTQLLDGAEGAANGGGTGVVNGAAPTTHHPPRDYRDDLQNSFHRPKLNFPRYDDESVPLP
jgi:hypothetical protein